MKTIFLIDWCLVPAFILSSVSGVALHIAGHGSDHAVWHNWALFHVAASLVFLVLVVMHVKTHWGWYRNAVKRGPGRKGRVTAAVTIAFAAISLTDIVLLGVNGANSSLGLWHYRLGLIGILLFSGHIIRRIPALRKSLKIHIPER